jgi:hypothetical protein
LQVEIREPRELEPVAMPPHVRQKWPQAPFIKARKQFGMPNQHKGLISRESRNDYRCSIG